MRVNQLVLIFLLFPFNPCSSQNKKTLNFTEDYLNVAFWDIQGNKQPLMKWGDDIDTLKYRLIGNFLYLNEKSWSKYLEELEFLTGKSFRKTEKDDYQILIYFGDLNDYFTLIGTNIPFNTDKYDNWSSRLWNNDYSLKQASFCLVPSKIKNIALGVYHLRKSMLKSLGILGELDNEYSIFYKFHMSSNNMISRSDKRLIKLHYNNAIKSGSSIGEVKKIISKLKNIDVIASEKL